MTEFDVRDDTFPDDIAIRDAMIAETAEKYLNNVLRVPAVKMVIAWELADKYSFYTDAAKKKDPFATAAATAVAVRYIMLKKPLVSRWRVPSRIPGNRRPQSY